MTMISPDDGRPSVSRTARYKKVTKPLLERKRRARINRCLDELKDLMVGAFEVEGDNISKLEKADILELTVRHLTKLHSPRDPIADAKRFQAGFGQCAAEACQFILSMPDVDTQIGQNLVQHLSSQINEGPLSVQVPTGRNFSPPVSPEAPTIWSSPREDPRDFRNNPAEKNIRYTLNNPCPETYRKQIGEDISHVPVNQSLVCDIATFNSSPTVHELSQPLAGLLMTVDAEKNLPQGHETRRADPVVNKKDAEIIRVNRDMDLVQNAKTKNIIIKKIREQILERQVKEIEPKLLPSSSRELPSVDKHYHSSPNEHVPTKRLYKRKHEKVDVLNSTETVDLRKKSKGEFKHFSPSKIDVVNANYDTAQTAAQNSRKFSNPQHTQMHSNNTESSYYTRDPRKNAYFESDLTVKNVTNPENFSSHQDHPEQVYAAQKRQADYRSIHPKKAIIRPLKMYEESDVSFRQETTRQYRISNDNYDDQPSRSSLRDQRFTNAPSHSEISAKHRDQSSREFYHDERQYRRVSDYEHMNKYANMRSRHEVYEQHHLQPDRIDRQYIHNPNQQQDDDDENMWRPW